MMLFHSDQGSQYASKLFRQQLWRYQIEKNMSRRGNCWDNTPVEKVFQILKTEWISENGYVDLIAAQKDIGLYLVDRGFNSQVQLNISE